MDKLNLWNRSRKALVVVNHPTVDEIAQYHKAMIAAGKGNSEWTLIFVVDPKKEKNAMDEKAEGLYISEKDFNIFGRLRNEAAREVFQRSFDVVLVIGDLSRRILKKVRKSNRHISIGLNCSLSSWDINLNTKENTPEHLINFVKQTLEKIE